MFTGSISYLSEKSEKKKVRFPLFSSLPPSHLLESQMATAASKGRVLLAYSGGLGQYLPILSESSALGSLPRHGDQLALRSSGD